ncbi:MAG: FAD-dependent oxidoreductase [Anaerolineales bacterium]|nr:FAD-dependent oxidoreductase [Anaerolineales bacterium]
MADTIVIIGAGPAGVVAVETLREHDRQSRVVMLSAEPFPPYSPPAMVDHFITGSNLHFWRAPNWAEQLQVDYRPGAQVTSVNPTSHQLRLADDSLLAYDYLVIATGSRLYAPLPGVDLPGVYNFKSLSAAQALIGKVKRGEARTAVIVGAGFIGMEIALLLRELGVQVIQVEMLDQVMPAMLDPFTATFALQLMRQRGVEVRLNTKAKCFVGEGQAVGVELETGEILYADLLIAATGVRPNIDFLEGSGIACRWGISVDHYLRTSAPDVYAAGDVVETPDRLTGEVFVHAILPNAIEQGRVVGLNLGKRGLGCPTSYEGAERMNSLKHLGLPILAAGLKHGDEMLRARVNGGWRTLYLQDDRLVGFQLIGGLHAAGALRTLLNRQENLRRLKDRLLEPNFGQGALVWSALCI